MDGPNRAMPFRNFYVHNSRSHVHNWIMVVGTGALVPPFEARGRCYEVGMTLSILEIRRDALGAVLRTEYEDVIVRMRDADPAARAAFLNKIHQTIDHVIGFYSSASVPGRKAFLEKMRKESLKMWKSGDWASALGLGISCLNAQSRVVTGDDATYVKLETARIIKEAGEKNTWQTDLESLSAYQYLPRS